MVGTSDEYGLPTRYKGDKAWIAPFLNIGLIVAITRACPFIQQVENERVLLSGPGHPTYYT